MIVTETTITPNLDFHNIQLQTQPIWDDDEEYGEVQRLVWLAEFINSQSGVGIIYTITVRDAKKIAAWLNSVCLKANEYHSNSADKETLENLLLDKKIKILVATKSLSNSIKKRAKNNLYNFDLGFIIHYRTPDSIKTYFDQVCQTAFGTELAIGILMAGSNDHGIHLGIRKEPGSEKWCETTWINFQRYVKREDCLVKFLPAPLGEPAVDNCGKCAFCLNKPIVEVNIQDRTVVSAYEFCEHSEFDLECNNKILPGTFLMYGFCDDLRMAQRAKTGKALSRWKYDVWGKIVDKDRRDKFYRDKLVDAVVDMILSRWVLPVELEWITCIPSLDHTDIVRSFSKRLAAELEIPFREVLVQVKSISWQNKQSNICEKPEILDGVFKAKEPVPDGAVLLVDDFTNSGWTLTIAAALLWQAGCKTVFPVALTSSKPGV